VTTEGDTKTVHLQAGAFTYIADNPRDRHLECWLVMLAALITKFVIWCTMVSIWSLPAPQTVSMVKFAKFAPAEAMGTQHLYALLIYHPTLATFVLQCKQQHFGTGAAYVAYHYA